MSGDKMKVKILGSFRSTDGNFEKGDEPNLCERAAKNLIAAGLAEKTEQPKPQKKRGSKYG
jgi:hypothetical protein